jgi:hypothetical protein
MRTQILSTSTTVFLMVIDVFSQGVHLAAHQEEVVLRQQRDAISGVS